VLSNHELANFFSASGPANARGSFYKGDAKEETSQSQYIEVQAVRFAELSNVPEL